MHNSIVIGLGNIGFLFDLDPKRTETWSHVSAYKQCQKTELVGAVEVAPEKIDLFKKHHPNIPIFPTIPALMGKVKADIISICTPTNSHHSILKELLNYPVKAVFCEKPLASERNSAKDMVRMCEDKGVVLAVNHTRRWDDNFLLAKKLIQEKRIGNIKAVNALYPGQIFNIGTHLLDTIRMLANKKVRMVGGISSNRNDLNNSDPSISGWLAFEVDIPCTFISTGKREDYIFEIDIIGDEGRIRILENGEKVELSVFNESPRYSGYRELSPISLEPVIKKDQLVEAIYDIVSVVEGKKTNANCSGYDGFASVAICEALAASAKEHGQPMLLET